jgi:protein-disulfide isomerase
MRHAIDGIAEADNRMTRRKVAGHGPFLALLLLAGLLGTMPGRAEEAKTPAPAPPSAFTPAQRAEIVVILRQALASDPSILRDAIVALQADEVRQHEAAAQAAIQSLTPALVATPGDPVAGNPQGDVTLVEFYDLHCPYCRRMLPVLDQLLHTDPKLRVVYKDIPVLGPGSQLGARAVLAAQRQGGYGQLQKAIMKAGGPITEESLHTAATRVGLDWARLQRDMADPAIEARIDANLDLARQLGVDGTPAFVVGTRMLPGAVDLAELQDAVAAARRR